MNEWEIAAAALGAAVVPCLLVCTLTGAMRGLLRRISRAAFTFSGARGPASISSRKPR